MSDASATPTAPLAMTIVAACRPDLAAGRYDVTVRQMVKRGDREISTDAAVTPTTKPTFEKTSAFWVSAPRFTLPSSEIYAMYPPPDAVGHFADSLPHVVFRRRTLPWERRLAGTSDRPASPWLALLTLEADELGLKDAAPRKPESRSLKDVLADRPKTFVLDPWERDDSTCTVLELPMALFPAVAPGWEDLPYLAHAREVRITEHMVGEGVEDEGWFSVVIGNRLPARGKEHHVYLVSLEGLEDRLPRETDAASRTPRDGTVRLVVLASWRFVDDAAGKGFGRLVTDLRLRPMRLPPPRAGGGNGNGHDAGADDAVVTALERGYVPLEHRTRQGHHTVSWYRGPLVPHFLRSSRNTVYPSADAALRYDRDQGLLDVSYAAAWQLGRLLALDNEPFVGTLDRLKLTAAQTAATLATRKALESRFGADLATDWTEIVRTFAQTHPLSADAAASRTDGAALSDSHEPSALRDAMEKSANAVAMPLEIRQFLGRLFLLHGVPPRYLAPHPGMVENETLSVFYLDTGWIGALVDGALSIGRVSDSALFLDKAMAGNFLADVAGDQLGIDVDRKANTIAGHLTGFLLRSDLVSGWPGMEIRASDAAGPLTPLRLDRIASDTLLGTYSGHIARLVITQPSHGLHFELVRPGDRARPETVRMRGLASDRNVAGTPAAFAAGMLARRVEHTIDVILETRTPKRGQPAAVHARERAETAMTERAWLVPMSVEALLVPDASVKVASLAPRFDAFDHYDIKLGSLFRPEPWERDTDTELEVGAHLHWLLPAALTHGVQTRGTPTPDGEVQFPRVPSRWLVLRVGAEPRHTRAWVVRSDDVDDDAGTKTIPTLLASTAGKYVATRIGRKYGYDESWETETDTPGRDIALTAVSAGNPVFAAFYPGCRNVFGLHDDLTGVDEDTLLYFVAGWYSRGKDDPLHPDYAPALVADHVKQQWGIGAGVKSTSPPPALTVCHGTIHGVRWKRTETATSARASYRVAVGNTSIEALSALVAAPAERGALWEPLLSAFQYGVLGGLDPTRGMPDIDAELHRRRFIPVDGGTQWSIQPVARAAGATSDDTPPPFPSDPDVARLFNEVDDVQHEHDRLAREIAALREEAYAAWFRSVRPDEPAASVETLKTAFSHRARDIAELAPKLLDALKDVRDRCTRLQAKGLRIPSGAGDGTPPARPEYELVATPMPWFWRASDPAVLLAMPHGARAHRYQRNGPAICRTADQIVTSLDISLAGHTVSVGMREWTFPLAKRAATSMPFDEIAALVHESLLLDPTRAEEIAASAYREIGITEPGSHRSTTLAETIRATLARAPRDGDEVRASPVRPDGAMTSWEPAWDPLFMVWEVQWTPTYAGAAPADLVGQWDFRDNTDYRTPRGVAAGPDAPRTYRGWTPLSLDASRQLQKQLGTAPGIASAFATWSVLTQTLGGFTDALITREQTLQLPPLGTDDRVNEAVAGVVGATPSWSPLGADGFSPIRAGSMTIARLWLVDVFGRRETVIATGDGTIANVPIVTAESLRGPDGGAAHAISLPPRIAQPARLLARWSARDPDDPGRRRESNANPATSPVLGWIVPDHLARRLLVCDARGHVRGEVVLTTAGVSWSPAPGFAERWDRAGSLAEAPDLRRFVEALENAGLAALDDLLGLIDDVSLSITAAAAGHGASVSALAGLPLALARASLTLEVWGRLATDQRTTDRSTGGAASVRVPVRMGDTRKSTDGVVGYFVGDDYAHLHPAFAASARGASGYVAGSDLELSVERGRVEVVVLMDPRAGVHVTCGILPAQRLELPAYVVADPGVVLESSFRVGPVLADPDAFRLPVPESRGAWAWVDLDPDRGAAWAENGDVAKPERAAIPLRPPRIHDGWLSFRHAETQRP